MKRKALAYVCLSYVMVVGGCSDPECADGQRKIGTVCVTITKTDAGAATAADGRDAEDDLETGGTSSRDAASSQPVDSGRLPAREHDAEAATTNVEAAVPDAAEPMAPGEPTQPPKPDPMPAACAPSTEMCDGKDNDCNGSIDVGAVCPALGNECQLASCMNGACVNNPKPAGTPCTKGVCDSAGTCTFCGDGVVNGTEQCDPKIPGVGTFLCSPECKSRRVYTRCIQDKANPLGENPGCDKGSFCGAEGFCAVVPPSKSVNDCPKLEGNYQQFIFVACLIACSSATDCPSILPKCLPLEIPNGPTSYCVPSSYPPA